MVTGLVARMILGYGAKDSTWEHNIKQNQHQTSLTSQSVHLREEAFEERIRKRLRG
jgi:hypothetical protein